MDEDFMARFGATDEDLGEEKVFHPDDFGEDPNGNDPIAHHGDFHARDPRVLAEIRHARAGRAEADRTFNPPRDGEQDGDGHA